MDLDTRRARRLVFLGSGTSTGVPVIGCECEVCRSSDPRDQRTRPSVMIECSAGNLLIDTTPDLRFQMLRRRYRGAHAILYTHAHADHLFGLDDTRTFPFHLGGPVPVYCDDETEHAIRRFFPYAHMDGVARSPHAGVPQLRFERIRPGETFRVLGQAVVPIRLEHGPFRVLGFRIDGLAYCTDVSKIPDESWPLLEGLDTLILDALRADPHPTHFSIAEALEVVSRLRPGRTYLTHISHTVEHNTTQDHLPAGVFLAYDGLTLPF